MAYETLDGATQARVLIVGGGDVDAAQFERAPRLELLVRAGIGLDRIDHTAAAERGVTVVNTPGYGTNEVADQAQMLLLACTRRLDWQRQRAGDDWPSIAAEGVPRLADSTVGLIGFGAIGRAMAQRCRALGSTVLATDPAIAADTAAELGVQLCRTTSSPNAATSSACTPRSAPTPGIWWTRPSWPGPGRTCA